MQRNLMQMWDRIKLWLESQIVCLTTWYRASVGFFRHRKKWPQFNQLKLLLPTQWLSSRSSILRETPNHPERSPPIRSFRSRRMIHRVSRHKTTRTAWQRFKMSMISSSMRHRFADMAESVTVPKTPPTQCSARKRANGTSRSTLAPNLCKIIRRKSTRRWRKPTKAWSICSQTRTLSRKLSVIWAVHSLNTTILRSLRGVAATRNCGESWLHSRITSGRSIMCRGWISLWLSSCCTALRRLRFGSLCHLLKTVRCETSMSLSYQAYLSTAAWSSFLYRQTFPSCTRSWQNLILSRSCTQASGYLAFLHQLSRASTWVNSSTDFLSISGSSFINWSWLYWWSTRRI